MNEYGEKAFELIHKGKLENILYDSIQFKSEDIYKNLIHSSSLPQIINSSQLPIYRAMMNDDLDKTNELLNLGANPNLIGNFSYVASYFCSSRKMYDFILSDNRFKVSFKALVIFGKVIDINAVLQRSDSRENPLYFSIGWDKLDFTHEFVRFSKFTNESDQIFMVKPIFDACEQANVGHLKCLLSAGVDLNVFDEDGRKPLHVTCENGFVEHTKLLLEYGCALHDLNKGHKTPYDTACWSGHKEIKEFLDGYIKINMPDNPPKRDY